MEEKLRPYIRISQAEARYVLGSLFSYELMNAQLRAASASSQAERK